MSVGVTKEFMVDGFNDDMSPGKVGQFDHRVPQRRDGTVTKHAV